MRAMATLIGHEAGNGGYRQGKPTGEFRNLLYSEATYIML
jgi:hypothetical protein